MTDLTATRSRVSAGPWAYAALALAISAAAVWVLAGVIDDALYTLTGLLGIAAFGSGIRGRREARRAGARTWPALTAIVLGGLLGGAVIVAFVAWSVYHLVS